LQHVQDHTRTHLV